MSLVVNPYAYFTDSNGDALNGYLYIGEVGKNAENYPIAIYYDNLLTTPAPNPLTVSAGYIYNGGTIAQIYASVDYSLIAKTTGGSLVYSSLNESGMTNGAIGTIDEMKEFVAPYNNYALNVLGNIDEGDGEGGLFYYDANSTATADDINIVQSTSGIGRWIRAVALYLPSTIAYTIATVDDFDSIPAGYTTAIVKDIDRGGTFIWEASGTANDGTIFDGDTGVWIRQYSGAVNVKWFGVVADGVTDAQPGFQAAVNYITSIGGGTIEFIGVFKIDTPILNISSNTIITGRGKSKIINGISSALGTGDTLFKGAGTLVNSYTITTNLDIGLNTVTVERPDYFSVGDSVTFTGDYIGRNCSVIIAITDNVLTLDRPASNQALSGSTLYKMIPIQNTVIGDFEIDFNGTTESPRYGFGVWLQYAKNCRVQNITSKNVGSKVVEFGGSFDCIISNISCNYGTYLGGDGGHSYLVRLSVSNDCIVEKCIGTYLRHTVDISGGSRNVVKDCIGAYCYSATYLTHGNNCKDNQWINNKSLSSQTAAFAFSTAYGDTGNIINGGYSENEAFLYQNQDGSTIVENVTIKSNSTRYMLTFNGTQIFQNCEFIASYPLINSQSATTNITFIGCAFKLSGLRSLASLTANTRQITITLNGCEVDCTGYEGSIFDGGSNTYLNLISCNVYANQTTNSSPLFSSVTKEINAYNSTFKFLGTGGLYFFGANTNTTLTLDGNRFINSLYIARRYTNGNCKMILGQNQYINSTIDGYTNWIGLNTIGAVSIGLSSAPVNGTWVKGAKILFEEPDAGGSIGAVCTTAGAPGTWKTFGAITA